MMMMMMMVVVVVVVVMIVVDGGDGDGQNSILLHSAMHILRDTSFQLSNNWVT